MGRGFYAKFAVNNLKKNAQTYIPYLLTCVTTVMMFYMIYGLAVNDGLNRMSGSEPLKILLQLGSVVVALFSLIFLLYTNGFLAKRRRKEFGLYNVLGMEKKHIAKIMVWETIYIATISLSFGILGGILLSKLMFLVLLKILHFEVQMGFQISFSSMFVTLLLFSGIFVLTLLNNLRQIHLANPIELLKGGQVGEREPKTKWLLIIIGATSLAGGYYVALTTESPLAALLTFFLAVVLVIIGTYCLFTAGSIGILKLLRRNKRYYYQPNHFTAVSGMIYRMKQNAVGLANICILSTMVLVTLSTTVSLYVGIEDVLRTRYPRNLIINSYNVDEPYIEKVRSVASEVLEKYGLVPENLIDYRSLSFAAVQDGEQFITDRAEQSSFVTPSMLHFVPVGDYNRIYGTTIELQESEALLFSNREPYEYKNLTVLGHTFSIKERLDSFAVSGLTAAQITGSHYLIVKDDDVIHQILEAQTEAYGEFASEYAHLLGFDLEAERDSVIAVHQEISASLPRGNAYSYVESAGASRDEFYSLYGGLFFLGIFLGTLFLMGTVLIIYYKQITEGYDDRQRFTIMRQVGMSKEEVKRSIRSQVLTVFFLPLRVSM